MRGQERGPHHLARLQWRERSRVLVSCMSYGVSK